MDISETISASRQVFNDLRNCMTDQQLIELATRIWDNKSYEEIEPSYFTECLANHIFEKVVL
jgi:hypothetical protein